MLSSILSWLNTTLGKVLFFLPNSPFDSFINSIETIPALGYLNYFLPIKEIIVICDAWLVAIGIFYIYSAIMRWVKVIE